jgi:hypothetical protein
MVTKWEYANGGFVYFARVFRHQLLFGHQPPYPTSVEWLLETIIGLSQPSGRFLGFITTVFKKRISKNGFWYIPTILKEFARKLSIIHWFFHENSGSFKGFLKITRDQVGSLVLSFAKKNRTGGSLGNQITRPAPGVVHVYVVGTH